MKTDVEALIESMVEAQCGASAGMRQKHVLRQALYGLVRQAQAEQRLQMRQSVQKLVGQCPVGAAQDEGGPATP